MKTDAFIAMLARGPVAASTHVPERRLAIAGLVASPLVIAAMLVALGLRPDLASAAAQPMFWLKLIFPLALALAAFVATARLARPADTAGVAWLTIAALVAAVWTLALVSLASVPADARTALVAGRTALPCVVSIAALAVPLLVASFLALRTLAPTRLRLAGAAAGLFAGSAAAAVYALHCDETAVAFLATWYVLGMLIPAALGALLGGRLLRWT